LKEEDPIINHVGFSGGLKEKGKRNAALTRLKVFILFCFLILSGSKKKKLTVFYGETEFIKGDHREE